MEFVLSITNENQISNTLCQIINIGIKGFSFDNIYNIDINDLSDYVDKVRKYDKKLFVSLNRIFHEYELEDVEKIISNPVMEKISGIYFSDLGLIELGNKYNILTKMIYTPETLLTNKYELEALKDSGISSFAISNEITKEDIKDIISIQDIKVDMIGFGYISMFYSKRKLISLYNNSINNLSEFNNGYLIEETRNDQFPILEGTYGTHIYRSKVFSIHNELRYLEGISFVRLEAYKIDSELLRAAEQAIIECNSTKLNDYTEIIDDGFLNIKTIYKKVL